MGETVVIGNCEEEFDNEDKGIATDGFISWDLAGDDDVAAARELLGKSSLLHLSWSIRVEPR